MFGQEHGWFSQLVINIEGSVSMSKILYIDLSAGNLIVEATEGIIHE
jgi:hypothetical protein